MGFLKLTCLSLVIAVASLGGCEAKSWFSWLYSGEKSKPAAPHTMKLSAIPGVLREEIKDLTEKLYSTPEEDESRPLILFEIDRRRRQLRNLPLLSRGMPMADFWEFIEKDDELAAIKARLRPHANQQSINKKEPALERLQQLSHELDAKREAYGMSTRKGQQRRRANHDHLQRHMSEEVKQLVNEIRDQLHDETDVEKIRNLREQLDGLYTRSEERPRATAAELAAIAQETADLEREREQLHLDLIEAHERNDDRSVHVGRIRMREINSILEQSSEQRLLTRRKEEDLRLLAEREALQGPPR